MSIETVKQEVEKKNDWPLLLKDMDKMEIKNMHYTPLGCGSYPESRKMDDYIKYGIINLDKSPNPSSHEVVTWIKDILKCEKTGHSGTLDPQVSGVLTICLDRSTRLAKSQQTAGKEYICVIEFLDTPSKKAYEKAIKMLIGSVFQRPPLMCAVKRDIRIRKIYSIETIEFSKTKKQALFRVSCEAGTYIRTLCVHIGLLMGCGAIMKELRRSRTGHTSEDEIYTLHDVLDAYHFYKNQGNEIPLRRVIRPLESLLINYPRIMIKDSCVSAICYGAKLSALGIVRYDKNINVGTEIVIITTKGEAVALGVALVASSEIANLDHGFVCKTKRVIMEKDLYPKSWGFKKEYEIVSN